MDKGSICLVPEITSLAGPGSFQIKLKTALEQRGFRVHHDPAARDTAAILVIAGTRRLGALWAAKRRGVRIVQRLNGINWVHRRRNLGFGYWLRAERANLLLAYTRRFIADHVVYQSNFTRDWWHDWYGETKKPFSVIHNGVDLQAYSPQGSESPPADHIRVQVVEGHLRWDNRLALGNALGFGRALQQAAGRLVELVVVADVLPELQAEVSHSTSDIQLTFAGVLPREQIPAFSRAAHLLYSAEINPSCPNSVIEALACGLPVAAFDTGALPELIEGDAGCLAPYGADPWKLEIPDFAPLVQAALPLLAEQQRFRRGARALAEARYSLAAMADRYLHVLLD